LVLTDEDSDADCYPQIFPRCAKEEYRAPDGSCKTRKDCSDECDGGNGYRMEGIGLCRCDKTRSVDEICNKACREESPKVTVRSDGNLDVTDQTTGKVSTVKLTGFDHYYGALNCTTSDCKMYNVDMTASGPVAKYGLGSALSPYYNATKSRRLQESTAATDEISNPVACIYEGEAFIFSIADDQHYPVYDKDSLINTNKNFDYGPFRELQRMIESNSSTITTFAFTFKSAGIFDFVDKANKDLHLVISVIGNGQQCPDPDIPLRTRTEASLLTVGAKTTDDIILEPDWPLICGLLSGFVALTALIIGGMYFFHMKAWTGVLDKTAFYREINLLQEMSELMKGRGPIELVDEHSENIKSSHNFAIGELQTTDDLDPSMFQAMHERLMEHKRLLEKGFNSAGDTQALEEALRKARALREQIDACLALLKQSDKKEHHVDSESESSEEEELPRTLTRRNTVSNKVITEGHVDARADLYQSITDDPNLTEKDKEALLADYNRQLASIESSVNEDKLRSADSLEARLKERAERRRKRMNEMKKEADQPSLVSAFAPAESIPEGPEIEEEQQKMEVEQREAEAELEARKSVLKDQLDKNLSNASTDEERQALIDNYNREVSKLDAMLEERRRRQEDQLQQRLAERKRRRAAEPSQPGQVEEGLQSGRKSVSLNTAGLNSLKRLVTQSLAKLEYNRALQEQERVHEREVKALREDFEREKAQAQDDPALNVDLDQAKRDMLAALDGQVLVVTGARQTQDEQLQERLRQKRQRQAELKKKQQDALRKLEDKQDLEREVLVSDLTRQSAVEMLEQNQSLSEKDRASMLRSLLEEKQERELAELEGRRKERMRDCQNEVLLEALQYKADQLSDTRKAFKHQEEAATQTLSDPELKRELERQKVAQAEAEAQIDFDFTNYLSQAQNQSSRQVEADFRQRFQDLTNRHMREAAELLARLGSEGRREMTEFRNDNSRLREAAEAQFELFKEEMQQKEQELLRLNAEKEAELAELNNAIAAAEARKKELAEIEKQRQELLEKQRKMLEESRRRGISPAQIEEMLREHEQALSKWEKSVDIERRRQQDKLNVKLGQKVRASHGKKHPTVTEQLRPVMEEELGIKHVINHKQILHEPLRDIESRLRIGKSLEYERTEVKIDSGDSDVLQTLLAKVKRVERIVANVDAVKFGALMNDCNRLVERVQKLSQSK
jgi:hypothetical protein